MQKFVVLFLKAVKKFYRIFHVLPLVFVVGLPRSPPGGHLVVVEDIPCPLKTLNARLQTFRPTHGWTVFGCSCLGLQFATTDSSDCTIFSWSVPLVSGAATYFERISQPIRIYRPVMRSCSSSLLWVALVLPEYHLICINTFYYFQPETNKRIFQKSAEILDITNLIIYISCPNKHNKHIPFIFRTNHAKDRILPNFHVNFSHSTTN